MKACKFRFIVILLSLAACPMMCAHAQGSFQNLGFESPITPLVPVDSDGHVLITAALPGWNGYLEANQQSVVLYDNFTLGSASISLFGSGLPVIEGNYTVLLQPGSYPAVGIYVGAAIAQTGMIPSDAKSLMFFGSLTPTFGQLQVTLDGQNLSFFALSAGPNYTVYGSDITGFAGVVRELRFTAPDIGIGPNNVYLDSISFSTVPIPEPGVFGLFAFDSLLLGWRFFAKRR